MKRRFCLGEYQIEVLQDNILVDINPYTARAFDVKKVMIYDFPSSTIVDSSTYFISKLIIEIIFDLFLSLFS
jgi:hypothetical protein